VEVRPHLDLVGLAVGDPADGGEGLQRLAVAKRGSGRVEGDQVALLKPFEPGGLAVVGLGKAALDAGQHVSLGDGVDPVAHGDPPHPTGGSQSPRAGAYTSRQES